MKKEHIEELFVKWVDHDLTKDEQAQLEQLLQDDPSLQEGLDAMRRVKESVQQGVPASVEPPYADFFNSQLMRKIDLEVAAQKPKERAKRWWETLRWAWAPTGALALVLAFLAGKRLGGNTTDVPSLAQAPQATDVPSVYIAENSLKAEVVSGSNGDVFVIVVDGLSALSDNDAFSMREDTSLELPVSYTRYEAQQFH